MEQRIEIDRRIVSNSGGSERARAGMAGQDESQLNLSQGLSLGVISARLCLFPWTRPGA